MRRHRNSEAEFFFLIKEHCAQHSSFRKALLLFTVWKSTRSKRFSSAEVIFDKQFFGGITKETTQRAWGANRARQWRPHREAWTKSYWKLKNKTSIIVVQALRMISWSPIQSRTKLTEVTWKLNFSKLRRRTLQWVFCMPGFNLTELLLQKEFSSRWYYHHGRSKWKPNWIASFTRQSMSLKDHPISSPYKCNLWSDLFAPFHWFSSETTIKWQSDDNLSRQSHLDRIMHKMLS